MHINYWNHIESMAIVDGTQQIFPKNILSLFDFLNLRPLYVYLYIYIHTYPSIHWLVDDPDLYPGKWLEHTNLTPLKDQLW